MTDVNLTTGNDNNNLDKNPIYTLGPIFEKYGITPTKISSLTPVCEYSDEFLFDPATINEIAKHLGFSNEKVIDRMRRVKEKGLMPERSTVLHTHVYGFGKPNDNAPFIKRVETKFIESLKSFLFRGTKIPITSNLIQSFNNKESDLETFYNAVEFGVVNTNKGILVFFSVLTNCESNLMEDLLSNLRYGMFWYDVEDDLTNLECVDKVYFKTLTDVDNYLSKMFGTIKVVNPE